MLPMSNKTHAGDQDTKQAQDGITARLSAFDVLDTVLNHDRQLDEAFALASRRSGKGGGTQASRDTAHARMMVLTTLRRLGQIDTVLNRFLTRKPGGKGRGAHTILRLNAAQILFLNTPPHAVGATALAVADQRKLTGFKGLINAVTRKVAASHPQAVKNQDASRLNMPDWLWAACKDAYGTATAREIGTAHLAEAPLDLTIKDGDASTWAEKLGGAVLPTGSVRLWNAGDVRKLPGYAQGAWWVQDAAAALPARLLINSTGEEDGNTKQVADLCAAPGGKTAQLAAAGLSVTAVEVSAARNVRLNENLTRLGLDASVVESDAGTWRPNDLLDGVLLDAPCSATGTIRRHPDLPWVKQGWDHGVLPKLQQSLLLHSATLVKPGAPIIYATCSILPEEGESLVARVLAESSDLVIDPISPDDVPGLGDAVTEAGTLRTLPSMWQSRTGPKQGGLDGFFIARFRRKA